jgi:hypothetical protein
MPRETLYLVSDGHPTQPHYLDGFRQDGTPVWVSNLQNVDPFSTEETAHGESKRARPHAHNCEVVPCRLNNRAWLCLVKGGRIVPAKRNPDFERMSARRFKKIHGHKSGACCLLGRCGESAKKDAWKVVRYERKYGKRKQ